MSVKRVWDIKNAEVSSDNMDAACNSRVLACLLANRGIDTPEKIDKFLNPDKIPLSLPAAFNDIQKSAERIKTAIDNGDNITIWGDFDADGITSVSILYLTLKKIGAKVDYYVPDRATESHGLNNKGLINIISKHKTKLIITVDCAISNIKEINLAKSLGVDVIVTDHHEAPEVLPDAFAIINPKAEGSLKDDLTVEELESLNSLSGAGVAFKLACKLLSDYSLENYVYELLPLVAIGTIGDVVELKGENRRLVKMGLDLIKSGKCSSVQKILQSAGVDNLNEITSETIAFYLVPRINAAGRLESPITSLNVFVSDDENVIEESVKSLNDFNSLRQELCDKTFIQAKTMYEKELSQNKKSIILYNEDWHIGIIGIVASKLVETYNKPAFLMTSDVNNPDIIRCSSRSIDGLNIHSLLSEHKDLFEGFGGHKMAAGFSFNKNKISFENFKNILNKTIDEYSQNIDFNSMKLYADMIIQPEELTFELIHLLDKLQPFGAMNPTPVFVMNNLNLDNYKLMGQNNNHLKMFLSCNNSNSFECIKWNCNNFNLPVNSKFDILFTPQINTFNSVNSIQLILSDFHSDNLLENAEDIKILDHRYKKDIISQVLDFIYSTKKTTAIFIQNPGLKQKLNIPEDIDDKLFNLYNIPKNTEQIMFFDCPNSIDDFNKILSLTDAKIVHLMNFGINELQIEDIITKLSGMIKYSLGKINGIFDVKRAANALSVDNDTIDCALTLFENTGMVDLDKFSECEYKINSLTPIELSKIISDDLYIEFSEKINNINEFRKFYLTSSINDIKESVNKVALCC